MSSSSTRPFHWSRSIVKYVLELLIVAFGVFLGMMVSEYKSDAQMRENIETSKKLIIDELESNKQSLLLASAYHQQIHTEFDSIRISLNEEIVMSPIFGNQHFGLMKLPSWEGIKPALINDTAYESAKLNGVFQNMDIRELKQISEIYKQLLAYKELSKSVNQKILDIDAHSIVADLLFILEITSNDLNHMEEDLSTQITSVIEGLQHS